MIISEFIQKWDTIPKENGIIQFISNESLLCFGRDYEGCRILLFKTVFEPNFEVQNKSFTIKKTQLSKVWQTTFKLSNELEEDVYKLFIWDLFEFSIGVFSEQELVSKLKRRLLIWINLFEAKSSTLSVEVLQGILGELVVINEVLLKNVSTYDAIIGWRGPLGEDQDFILRNEWIEVKSIRLGKEKVKISSIEQLDRDDLGRMIIVEFERSSELDPLSININEMILAIRKKIGDEVSTILEFERRLLCLGYVENMGYEKIRFVLKRIRDFRVDQTFPRLTRTQLRSEIVNAEYSISISTIEPWRGELNYEA